MEYVIVYLLVNVVVGLAACLFGRRLFYVLLGLLVFLGVFNVALTAADATPTSLVIAAVLGLVAALLSRYAYKVGAFLVGFVTGAALGFIVALLLPREAADFLGIIVLVAGALVGLLAVRFSDAAVRVGTAWTGASYAVPSVVAAVTSLGSLGELAVAGDALATFDAVAAYVSGPVAATYATPILVGTVALAVVGVIVQGRQR